jgi:uncharacterized membrane protein HdeD (DUF308 family)
MPFFAHLIVGSFTVLLGTWLLKGPVNGAVLVLLSVGPGVA